MPIHVLDTSIWIRLNRNHPEDIFVSLWKLIDEAILAGEILAPEEALHELRLGQDDLGERLRRRDGLFVPLTPEMQDALKDVLARCPTLANAESERNRADPMVVALARLRDGVVVTEERPRRIEQAPMKIPDACRILGIRSLGWFDFLRDRGWRL